jgi:hypothetical protein
MVFHRSTATLDDDASSDASRITEVITVPGFTASATAKGGSSGSPTVADGAAVVLFTGAGEELGVPVGMERGF